MPGFISYSGGAPDLYRSYKKKPQNGFVWGKALVTVYVVRPTFIYPQVLFDVWSFRWIGRMCVKTKRLRYCESKQQSTNLGPWFTFPAMVLPSSNSLTCKMHRGAAATATSPPLPSVENKGLYCHNPGKAFLTC